MRFLLSVFAVLFAAAAMAAESPADGKAGPARGACRDEMRKICGDARPGDGHSLQCIQANQEKFSPACRERMARVRDRAEAAYKACEADVQKHCNGVEAGGGRLQQCLKKNEAALSADCRATLQHKPRHPRPAKDAT